MLEIARWDKVTQTSCHTVGALSLDLCQPHVQPNNQTLHTSCALPSLVPKELPSPFVCQCIGVVQAGDLRWKPHPAYSQLWNSAAAVLAAEAAAAATYGRRSSSSSGGSAEGEAGPGGRWSSLAGLRASADGWMQRMTDGLTGGLARIRDARGMFRKDTDTRTERSGRSSMWGFGSHATSKATSKAASTAGHSAAASAVASAAASTVASRATSVAISNATSAAVSDLGTVDSSGAL
jgi:hypothetical protein